MKLEGTLSPPPSFPIPLSKQWALITNNKGINAQPVTWGMQLCRVGRMYPKYMLAVRVLMHLYRWVERLSARWRGLPLPGL